MRLAQVSHAMRGHKESNQSIGADALVALSGFAPPTLHSLGARVASGLTRRLFNVVVTNVPGPQFPLYAAGAQLLEGFPVVPLAKNQAVSIGLTSYNGGVYFGLNADRDAMPDVDVLAQCIEESLAELVETVRCPAVGSSSARAGCSARRGRSARCTPYRRPPAGTRARPRSSSAPPRAASSPRSSAAASASSSCSTTSAASSRPATRSSTTTSTQPRRSRSCPSSASAPRACSPPSRGTRAR